MWGEAIRGGFPLESGLSAIWRLGKASLPLDDTESWMSEDPGTGSMSKSLDAAYASRVDSTTNCLVRCLLEDGASLDGVCGTRVSSGADGGGCSNAREGDPHDMSLTLFLSPCPLSFGIREQLLSQCLWCLFLGKAEWC